MKSVSVLIAAIAICSLCQTVASVQARTKSVVTFQSKMGIIFVDSKKSLAAYRLFESLKVPVTNQFIRQTKVFAPKDGTFRISCSALSTDYACAVIVYAGKHAKLDFDTDRIELHLPAELSTHYTGVFPDKGDGFHFKTEDNALSIDWSPSGLHIKASNKRGGRDI